MEKKRKNYMAYFKCHACGYSVSISTRWAEVGAPRCLNLKCGNVSKLLTMQISAKSVEVLTAEADKLQNGELDAAGSPYSAKRYNILTKLNGESHESALAIITEENKENVLNA